MNFRKFLNVCLLVVFLGFMSASGALAQQVPLNPNKIPQFVEPLPLLSVQGGPIETVIAGTSLITLRMCEFQANVLPTGTLAPGAAPQTWVWGYLVNPTGTNTCAQLVDLYFDGAINNITGPLGTYIGPTIVATRGTPTEIRFVNDLGLASTTNVLAYKNSTDQTLHWANPNNLEMFMGMCNIPPIAGVDPPQCFNYAGPIPAVPHLHGGEVPPVLDGGPDAWFLSQTASGYTMHGPAYYSKDGNTTGDYTIYRYPNSQEAAMIWFHDHTLGATRLNVYMGLAGAFPIIDTVHQLPTGLHPVGLQRGTTTDFLIPLVVQDRMFDTTGQLFFPNIGINPEHPYWIPEFVGDTIAVNGKVWPFLNVDRKRYRFLFLDGSNARAYDMFLADPVSGVRGPRMWVIGTDGGYLDAPMLVDPNSVNKAIPKSLVMMPGERYDVIIDFNDTAWVNLINAAYAALGMPVPNPLNLILRNTAKTPFPGGAPASQSTTGRIMQFRVSTTTPATDSSYNPATGGVLRGALTGLANPIPSIVRLTTNGVPPANPAKTRQLTLNEVMGAGGPLEILVNNTKWSGKRPDGVIVPGSQADSAGNYFTEFPNEGDTEVWEIINLTADAHPIHTHLTQFQLINRQNFDVNGYNAAYAAAFPGSQTIIDPMTGLPYVAGVYIPAFGPPNAYNTANADGAVGGNPAISGFLKPKKWPVVQPQPWEKGWKDTVIMYPGQVTRIAVRYTPTDYDPALGGGSPSPAYYPFDPNALDGDYVWHCHIVDHEDNEMMRPYQVNPKTNPDGTPLARTYRQGIEY